MRNATLATLVCAGLLATARPASADGDPEAGRDAFHRCAACHSIKPRQNKVGPSLYNVVGRRAGVVDNYRYSDAMQNSGLTWDRETLSLYLEHPRDFLPGTKMAFAGIEDEAERQDVIAYLATLKPELTPDVPMDPYKP
jgi:cytochrome c